MKIERDAMGTYHISIGAGKPASSRSLQGVVYALEHYFRDGVPGFSGAKFDYTNHIKHAEECDCCPLCRD